MDRMEYYGSELDIKTRPEKGRNKVVKLRQEFKRNRELVAAGYTATE